MDHNATIATGRWARAGDRRVRLVALCVSLVVHIIAFFALLLNSEAPEYRAAPVTTLWTLQLPDEPNAIDIPDITVPETALQGNIAFSAEPLSAEDRGDAVVPRAVDLPYTLDVLPGLPGAVAPLRDADPLRGRLEYRAVPERDNIWRPLQPVELSADDYARQRVAARLNMLNDSIAAIAGARATALDWTKRTADGKRWGVTPDSIYVGDIAVKNRFEFSPPPGRRDEIAGRLRTYSEIQYQVNRIEGNDIVNDRIKAIRARMDAERAKRNATTTGGTTGG